MLGRVCKPKPRPNPPQQRQGQGKEGTKQRRKKSQKPDPHGIRHPPNRSSGLLGSRGVKRGRVVPGSVLRFRIFFTATPDPRGAAMSTAWGWLGLDLGFSDPKEKKTWLPGEKRRGRLTQTVREWRNLSISRIVLSQPAWCCCWWCLARAGCALLIPTTSPPLAVLSLARLKQTDHGRSHGSQPNSDHGQLRKGNTAAYTASAGTDGVLETPLALPLRCTACCTLRSCSLPPSRRRLSRARSHNPDGAAYPAAGCRKRETSDPGFRIEALSRVSWARLGDMSFSLASPPRKIHRWPARDGILAVSFTRKIASSQRIMLVGLGRQTHNLSPLTSSDTALQPHGECMEPALKQMDGRVEGETHRKAPHYRAILWNHELLERTPQP
jgi:hypothetical protein